MTLPGGEAPMRVHPFDDWTTGYAGLVAGITAVPEGSAAGSDSDYGLTSGGDSSVLSSRYLRLAREAGMAGAVVGRQVHGIDVHTVAAAEPGHLRIVGEVDGLLTGIPGVLLAVTAADCVPVFLADASLRCVGLVHAGWRGAAEGILERGLCEMERGFGVPAASVRVHLGPAICGDCYVVGTEVLRAFGKEEVGPALLDLRDELAGQAVDAGVSAAAVTRSAWCTSCGPVPLHSHRKNGARAGRMAAFAGLLPVEGSGKAGRELRI